MKKILSFILILFFLLTFSYAEEYDFTVEETNWIQEHQGDTFTLGLDPYSGMDYFTFRNQQMGYILEVVKIIEDDLGINIEIIGDSTWGNVYDDFIKGDIDILFGANVTEERQKIMNFTNAIHKYPYAIFVSAYGSIRNLGDLDTQKVGFIEGDIAIELFQKAYPQLKFEIIEFKDQVVGLEALEHGHIEGFITSGGGIVYDFIYNYPGISFLTDLNDITSDMTLATLNKDDVFNRILSKVIDHNINEIDGYVHEAEIQFNRKILNLSEDELNWLDQNIHPVVGISKDYLPFDYYEYGEYKGITGTLIHEISNLVGITFDYDYGDFDTIYQKALEGSVDIINIAKTTDRLEKFIFPRAFSEERDEIYGLKKSSYVQDIYGLENKRVAVIKGFWHEEFLKKNLRNVDIVITENILETLKLIDKGEVDYFIENPTVAEFYISGMGYWDIVSKGETSRDSFLYFGINKSEPELAAIIDKTLQLIDYEKIKQTGLSTVPSLVPKSVTLLVWIVGILMIIISIVGFILYNVIQSNINEKAEKAMMKEREQLMYLDPLTGLSNRLSYNLKEKEANLQAFPQTVIISDLNDLKKINDTLGHHIGDAYIRKYGEILRTLPKEASVFRMGGDEFLILIVDCDAICAENIIQDLTQACENAIVEFEDIRLEKIDVAVGYDVRYDANENLETVGIRADNMMYAHKKKMKILD
ncbi:MAG: transporter substrate-binding domain-containing protein [Clostridia bacterium]|nr:transporter substrate-binding domain-containing protein [Clostridia bacterium]